jgi:hypothetical protein
MTHAGVGAVVDLPGMSVIVRGLDAWPDDGARIIEPRLLEAVRTALPGPEVTELRAAPVDPNAEADPYTAVGIPVTTFPRWLRCPACYELLAIDGTNQVELIHRIGKRPDLAKWVHTLCTKQANRAPQRRRACIPARFLVACTAGHLDEFPYVDFVHRGGSEPCRGPRLELSDAGSLLTPQVTIKCRTCGLSRNISSAAGPRGAAELPSCRGRHPHLQSFELCNRPLKLLVLGASNLWFASTVSALHLPEEDDVGPTLRANWTLLSAQPSPEILHELVVQVPALEPLRRFDAERLWTLVDAARARQASGAEEPAQASDLRAREWERFAEPTTTDHDEDFQATPVERPATFRSLLAHVVQVERLREVQALVGFTRIDFLPDAGASVRFAPLAKGRHRWVPAVEHRGEGIFLQLDERLVESWVRRVEHHPRVAQFQASYRNWQEDRGFAPDPLFPIPRLLLVHTLSHLLLREVALECGYSSASIRERLYVGTPARPTAGFLLSTAGNDVEGTLGGLVALGDPRFLGTLLQRALDGAKTCSSDPLCAERVPVPETRDLHGAACHACLFASETSCEHGNRWLDRATVVEGLFENFGLHWNQAV